MDVDALAAGLAARAGVAAVHDLHVWTLTSGLRAASGHVVLADGATLAAVLADATELLEREDSIQHVALQCEPPGYRVARREI